MFTGFSQATQDFLWGLLFHNERPWFEAHRAQYQQHLALPFRALALDTAAGMRQLFPQLDLTLHIARIYRDARRLHGRGPYKEHLWFSLSGANWDSTVSFWFEIGAADFAYGLGMYGTGAEPMARYRRSIAANPSAFARIVQPIVQAGIFEPCGEEYKRPKGDLGPVLNPWYNRKYIDVEHSEPFGPALFSPDLPQVLANGFQTLMPLYLYINTACGLQVPQATL